jgi:crossover junction endodeoxyribonuclease RusA
MTDRPADSRTELNASHIWIIQFDHHRVPPLSLNKTMHWAVRSKITRALRADTKYRARVLGIPPLRRVQAQLVWHVTDSRTRDTDNPVPTLKAMCDGLVDAGIVPDDKPEFMSKPEVEIRYRPRRDGGYGHLTLEVREL